MEKQETFVSGFGCSSVELRQLEVRRFSDYLVDQSRTGATVLERGKEAGPHPCCSYFHAWCECAVICYFLSSAFSVDFQDRLLQTS